MNANSYLDEAKHQNRIVEVARFEGSECIGRGRAMALDPLLDLSDFSAPAPDQGIAVMLEDCGDPKESKVKAGAIVAYWTRPGDGKVISSAASISHGVTYEMPPMTSEEVDEALTDSLIEEDDQTRAANIEAAEREGCQFQEGVGWVTQGGVVRLEDTGRKL